IAVVGAGGDNESQEADYLGGDAAALVQLLPLPFRGHLVREEKARNRLTCHRVGDLIQPQGFCHYCKSSFFCSDDAWVSITALLIVLARWANISANSMSLPLMKQWILCLPPSSRVTATPSTATRSSGLRACKRSRSEAAWERGISAFLRRWAS